MRGHREGECSLMIQDESTNCCVDLLEVAVRV